jgi:hypothetical protein
MRQSGIDLPEPLRGDQSEDQRRHLAAAARQGQTRNAGAVTTSTSTKSGAAKSLDVSLNWTGLR